MGIDHDLIARTRFAQDPAACIAPEVVAEFAAQIALTAEYRRAMGKEMTVAVPARRRGLFVRAESQAVQGWNVLELRFDVNVASAGEYASIRAFLLAGGEILCVVYARDRSVMRTRRMRTEDFARMVMTAWLRRDSAVTYYDADAMNEELTRVCQQLFREHIVTDLYLADGSLCRSLMGILAP